MKHRVGLILMLLGFLELAGIFAYVNFARRYAWESPLPSAIDVDILTFMGSVMFVMSPFLLIVIGTFCLETGSNYRLQARKQAGKCWKCGHSLRDSGPEYTCPKCGHEHDNETIRLYLEIADRKRRLRELGNE